MRTCKATVWGVGLFSILILMLAMSPYGTWLTGTARASTQMPEEVVGAGTDDGYETNVEVCQEAEDYVCLRYASDCFYGFYRFTSIPIPQGATIDGCTLFVDVTTTSYDDPDVDIFCEDTSSAATLSGDNPCISNRTETTEYVDWTAEGIGVGYQPSPGLKTIVQEVINRGDWSSGNDLAFIFVVNLDFAADFYTESYENGNPAKLHIWYTTGYEQTKKISGTTNVEDTFLREVWVNHAYGGATKLRTRPYGVNDGAILIRVLNVASELGVGATNITAVCSMFCEENTTDGDLSAYRVFKVSWGEGNENGVDDDDGDATWNDWASDADEWTTPSCGSADDEGEDNSGDGTGADRKATAEDTESVTTVDTWYAWNISEELATGWYNGSIGLGGIVIPRNADDNVFTSTEGASNQPFFVFTYTTDGEPVVGQVIIIEEE